MKGRRLSEPQRRAVLRRLAAGFSYGATAEATGIPRGTVGTLARAAIISGRLPSRSLGRDAKPEEAS